MTPNPDRSGWPNQLLPSLAEAQGGETRRLAALQACGILDTAPEDAYDRVTELARILCRAPIAAVGFIDSTRLWLKARRGFELTEAPRAMVFCDHVIRQDGVMVVPDSTLDMRFSDSPLVTEAPRLRFYAGAPLLAAGGQRLGTVCVLSTDPRADFSQADTERLAALAGIVSHALDLRLQAGQAERLAREREVLLQAVEHRLRSGLQLVSCVLQAQAMRHTAGAVRRALHEAADRVATIEAVHQQLFQDGDVFGDDARDFLLALIGNLRDSVVDDGDDEDGGRSVLLDLAHGLRIAAERMPAVGLVVTELLSNALRHGAGTVTLAVAREHDTVTIRVIDQGSGFGAEDPGTQPARRLGLQLVELLALPDGVSIGRQQPPSITVRMRA